MENYYDILQLNINSSREEVRKSYINLAKKYHPDICKEQEKIKAEEYMKLINLAYDVLNDDEKRANYDLLLKSQTYSQAQAQTSSQTKAYTQDQNQDNVYNVTNQYIYKERQKFKTMFFRKILHGLVWVSSTWWARIAYVIIFFTIVNFVYSSVQDMEHSKDNAKLNQIQTLLDSEQSKIQSMETDLKKIQTDVESLDKKMKAWKDAQMIDKYNSNVDNYNNLVTSYENEYSEYKDLVNTYNGNVNEYNTIAKRVTKYEIVPVIVPK